jgi:hypothetical protein
MKKAIWISILKLVLFSFLFFLLIYVGIQFLKFSQKFINNFSEGFNSEKVVNEFYSYVESIEGSNKLHVASIKSVDRFSKKDSQSILWNLISLPDVVIELHVPVEYNYYVDLKGKWEFSWEESDSTIYVIAPEINYFPPAVNISQMEIFEKESSIIRDSERVKENLRKELTDKLDIVAKNKIILIREIARMEVSQFLITWFPKSNIKNIDSENLKLKLIFNDEREINVVNNINSHIE